MREMTTLTFLALLMPGTPSIVISFRLMHPRGSPWIVSPMPVFSL